MSKDAVDGTALLRLRARCTCRKGDGSIRGGAIGVLFSTALDGAVATEVADAKPVSYTHLRAHETSAHL
eukprot:9153191-Alexandrium_andersonii.AAC.1